MSPYFLKWRGRPVFPPPLLFGSRHFLLFEEPILILTVTAIFTKFSQLILRKIIKIVTNRCQILKQTCTKFDFGWSSAPGPRPRWGAYSPCYLGLSIILRQTQFYYQLLAQKMTQNTATVNSRCKNLQDTSEYSAVLK